MKALKDFKYKSTFASKVTKIVNSDIDKFVSLASLDSLKGLMPASIDFDKNPDLIGIALNAAVAGRVNLNDDSISKETALEVSKHFQYKYCDAEHDRNKIIGVICNYGYSKFGSNEVLTEESAAKEVGPFNISLAVLLYGSILTDEFIELLESSADENSRHYGRVSASWEIYFDDYDICVGSKNVDEAEIISDTEEKKKFDKYLRANGGAGEVDGKRVYRVIKGEFVIPAGIGLVENPAAEVKGLTIAMPEKQSEASKNEEIVKNISHSENNNVKVDSKDSIIMKIKSIKDITSESLKQVEASAVVEFIEEGLKVANEDFKKEQGLKEQALKDKAAAEKSVADLNEKIQTLSSEIDAFKKKEKDRADLEAYNQRLAHFNDLYELDEEDQKVIASQIKGLDDVGFNALEQQMKVLLKNKSKAAIAEAKEAKEKAEKEAAEKAKVSTASVDKKEDKIDDAVDKGEKAAAVPNAATASQNEDFIAKYGEAFSPERCIVKTRK